MKAIDDVLEKYADTIRTDDGEWKTAHEPEIDLYIRAKRELDVAETMVRCFSKSWDMEELKYRNEYHLKRRTTPQNRNSGGA